jgi:hypothetical protein
MKKRGYIETTVVSYLTARPNRDLLIAGHQEATRELWPKLVDEYEPFVSALVYDVEYCSSQQSVYPHDGPTYC